METRIRVGIGGWTYEPWRDNFYPKGLAHARELEYASRRLTAIEVNGTYYSTMKPATFAKWRDETPEGFVFALKANRFATNRKVLAGAGESIERFIASGVAELKERLGPILWQFMDTKKFDAACCRARPAGSRCDTCWTCATKASPTNSTWTSRAGMAARPCTPTRRSSRTSRTRTPSWPTCA